MVRKWLIVFLGITVLGSSFSEPERSIPLKDNRPNIIWIIVEDMSCHFGYQGEEQVKTPNVDMLAKEGTVFTNAYTTGPVCSASRSALITGMFQTSIGAHHHRSSRGATKHTLPDGMKTIPELFRQAGYCTINTQEDLRRKGKEDYNFDYQTRLLYDSSILDSPANRPFFAQIQLRGGKLRDVDVWYKEVLTGLNKEDLVRASDVEIPVYYPDEGTFRSDWAAYLNAVQYTDLEVGRVMASLKDKGLLDNTIVFFTTDHGVSQARGKQFLYDEGTKVPFIVWGPARIKPGIDTRCIQHIDAAATSLEFAGISIPAYLQSQDVFGKKVRPFVVSARDRCDETVDRIRSVRDHKYKYIRNYYPHRPYLQPNCYKDHKPWMPVLRKLYANGKLDRNASLIMRQTRPKEELYDLVNDPYELNNLATNKSYANQLKKLRSTLDEWIENTGDQGQYEESEEDYLNEMKVYINAVIRTSPEEAAEIKDNVATMLNWIKEGK